jgi:hypothetical protein
MERAYVLPSCVPILDLCVAFMYAQALPVQCPEISRPLMPVFNLCLCKNEMQAVNDLDAWRLICLHVCAVAFPILNLALSVVFAPAMDAGPRLLHGDLWVGNMALDSRGKPIVLNPASW